MRPHQYWVIDKWITESIHAFSMCVYPLPPRLQTFDYARGTPVSLNHGSLHLSPDKEFTIVLSERNPFSDSEHERRLGANWLSSEGRPTGTIFFRFVLPEGAIRQPETELVPAKAAVLSRFSTNS